MLARVDLRGFRRPPRARSRDHRPRATTSSAAVAAIIADGPRAAATPRVRELTARFDGCRLDDLAVPPAELGGRARARSIPSCAPRSSSPATRSSRGTRRSAGDEPEHERSGVRVREVVVPVDRAGCYVPGGRAPLASSVLMTALPGAGRRRAATSRCARRRGPTARVHDAILAAARARRGRRGVPRRWRAGDRRARVRHRDASPRST